MSSDTGTRKRIVQTKKQKASTGNISPGEISVRELPAASKLSADESIHVQKDEQFDGNWYMAAVFIVIWIALAAGVWYYVLNGSVGKETKSTTSDWISSLQFDLFASEKHSQEEPIHEQTSVDEEPSSSYLDILWSYYPFGQNDASHSSSVIPSKTKREENTSEESDNEKDSREDYSKESFNDDELDHDKNDDENEHESEENQDDEKNTEDDDDQKDEDHDKNDDSKSTEDSENTYESYFSYKKSDVEDVEKDDVDSSDENEKKVDRRDQRFNYYHQKSDEEHKYKYIKGEDDSNDSSEQGANEKFDSGENTKDEDEQNDEDRENDSHSSEEVEPSDDPFAEDALESEVPEIDELSDFDPLADEPESEVPETDEKSESGSMVTKLSVGIALIFVAYSVIIRKWNNYVNRVADEALNNIGNDGNLADIAQTMAENLLDSKNSESSETENKTLQDYLETPSNSTGEQSEDDSASEPVAGKNIPIDSKKSQTASETGSEVEDDEYAEYGKSNYKRMNITNRADWPYRHQLDEADDDWDREDIFNAILKYAAILKRHPRSVRAQYGMVRFHDWRSDRMQSNTYLHNVIRQYKQLLKTRNVPQAIEKIVAEKVVERMRFLGIHKDCIPVQKMLIKKYPEELSYQNDLVVTYLILNRYPDAETVLKRILKKDRNHGLALVNYGYIKKMYGELETAITALSKGIQTGMKGTEDNKFYYHLGDALLRLGRRDEASKLHETAAEKGVFLSKYQRPVFSVKALRSQPWWNPADTGYKHFFRRLENNWKIIRNEVISVIEKEENVTFHDETEQLSETGKWKQSELLKRGIAMPGCKKFPVTCGMIKAFAPAATCRQGQVKFSLIKSGTHIWPHCGPTNARLRAHLGLIIPENVFIRVAEETKTWQEGKVLLFDDSFEHEVWNNDTSDRLVLLVDVWHPDLSARMRKMLAYI